MVGLALLVTSVGLADSINPSTVVPALWLAKAPRARGIAAYTLGVFTVYFAGGLVLVFGPGPSLIAALQQIKGPFEHALQAAGGAAVLAFAIFLWRSRHQPEGEPRAPRAYGRGSAFALGAGIMAVELPTAFMYFGAISAILAARLAAAAEVSLLLVYNLLFVAPLIALLAVRRLAGHRGDRWIAGAQERLRAVGQLVLACVAGAAGSALLTIGVGGLLLSG
ncbi:MAG: GAP family protein [Solirubrobacterales bacterium]|nr:GAP family protein [Solirubrobacterales bacterium]